MTRTLRVQTYINKVHFYRYPPQANLFRVEESGVFAPGIALDMA